MNVNTTIKKHQAQIANAVNQAGKELPAAILQLILQNILYQVDTQVNASIQQENTKKETTENIDESRGSENGLTT